MASAVLFDRQPFDRMTGKDELKRAVCDAIIELGDTILHQPETGFNEGKTAALIAERMRALGLEPQTGLALTGVKGRLKGKTPGPRLAFIGELDSLRTSDHPLADPTKRRSRSNRVGISRTSSVILRRSRSQALLVNLVEDPLQGDMQGQQAPRRELLAGVLKFRQQFEAFFCAAR
jgi:hypothetical protein